MSKYALMGSVAVCATAMALSSTAFAQDQSTPAGDSPQVSEVTVTGSRIISDGTDAPTPVEVVGAAQIQTQATGDIAALLNTLPAFAGNQNLNNTSATQNITASLVGLDMANLRGLGPNRTLTLVDGERFIPTLTYGSNAYYAVDLGQIPQQLIQRVETVTGGASAVYGSDAIGGAVNFILDKKFTGLKVDASGGETTYGDDANEKVDITFGTRFAGDRGHFIISGESYSKPQLTYNGNRAWEHKNYCIMQNPAWTPTGTGQPQLISEQYCGENSAPGGVINASSVGAVQSTTTSPLRGITFGVGGVPLPFVYGTVISTPIMAGNPNASYQLATNEHFARGAALDPEVLRQNVFSLLSYDLTDRIRATAELSWSHTSTVTQAQDMFYDAASGVGNGIATIYSDNAFIPASLRPVIAANGITSMVVSSLNGDLPPIEGITSRYVERASAALDGDFDAFKSNWVWNAYYTYGKTRNRVEDISLSRSRYALAIDSVVGPNGNIICRANSPTPLATTTPDPACVPWDVFGIGVNSPQAIAYVQGTGGIVNQDNIQQVAAASITGKPFSLWAGPVGVALNAEYRFESAEGHSNAGALANDFYSGNYKPINGSDNVVEGALEINVPLAKDFFLAKSANIDMAVRETDYSTSGSVTTWKVGATYQPIDDITFRGNISHDIRAPNLGELYAFAGAPVVTPGLLDPFTNNNQNIARVSQTGNPNLLPEQANSQGFGVVYKPSFIPGLSMSVDFWQVHQHGQIGFLTGQQAENACFGGNQQACGFITRGGAATLPGVGAYAGQLFAPVTLIATSYVNIASVNSSGLDEFVGYRFPLKDILPFPGDVSLSYVGSYYFKAYTNPGIKGAPSSTVESYWRGILSAQYDVSKWSVGLSARYASPYANVNSLLAYVCAVGTCPASNTLPSNVITRDALTHASTLYFDGNLSRDFKLQGRDAQLYLNIRNLFNRAPEFVASGGQPFATGDDISGDDALGRIFRIGLRVKM
jgi:iron complex outermembrane receptor protein